MMMSLLTPRLTEEGISMVVAALNGDSITFTRAVIGNTATEPTNPTQLSDVVSPMVTASFTAITEGDNFVTLAAVFDNLEVETGAYASELGLYAKDENDNEHLYAYTYVGENADYIPAHDSGRTVQIQMTIVVAVGDAEDVDAVLIDAAAYATREEFEDHINDHNNPHEVTKEQVGLGLVENNYFVDNDIVVDQLTTAANVQTGDTLREAMSKIWYWIQKIINGTAGYIPLTGYGNIYGEANDGVSGDILFTDSGSNTRGIGGRMSLNDYWRIVGAGSKTVNPHGTDDATDCGYLEIATADNGSEPIILRQYDYESAGGGYRFNRVKRTAYLLNYLGNTIFPGSCTATSHPTSSDLKKKDVHGDVDLQTAEALIMGLQPIFYNFKGDWKESAGFGAQDVYKLAHEIGLHDNGMYRAAKMPDKDGNAEGIEYHDADIEALDDSDLEWNLNYTEFIPYLVKVIQDQQVRLVEQEKRIDALEEKLMEVITCLQ